VSASEGGTVTTVRGPVPADALGVCSPHEHLLVDVRDAYWRLPEEARLREFAHAPIEITNLYLLRRHFVQHRDNLALDDVELAVAELEKFRELGGRTLVDVTPADIGREPLALREISRRTGVHIVAGCGHYVHLAHRPELADEPLESIVERIVRDLQEGIDGTDIRAGIIGEIGTSYPLHPTEEKVLRAAVRAQDQTGAALTIHLHPPSRSGLAIVEILDDEGADLTRVVMGHVDIALGHLDTTGEDVLRYQAELARRGCYVEFDTCGFPDAYMPKTEFYNAFWFPSDRDRAWAIAQLIDLGYLDQVLVAQDVCHKHHLTRYGGYGYGHVLREFTGSLRDFGLGQSEIDRLLVDNPARMLALAG
jgi:phosphotriesterase-related protein